MKNPLEARFMQEMMRTTANMYRLGYDERNGGNISVLLDEAEVAGYIDLSRVSRTIPNGFEAMPLPGKLFRVTGTGK
jgi:rhamnulose-1-phosphate aldolase